jgi:uncharacterized membrane protein HdeD (DUF308 family)
MEGSMMDGINLTLVIGVAWLAAGVFMILSVIRHRRYIQSLPPSPGNQRIQRNDVFSRVAGVGAIVLGVWYLVAYFRQ